MYNTNIDTTTDKDTTTTHIDTADKDTTTDKNITTNIDTNTTNTNDYNSYATDLNNTISIDDIQYIIDLPDNSPFFKNLLLNLAYNQYDFINPDNLEKLILSIKNDIIYSNKCREQLSIRYKQLLYYLDYADLTDNERTLIKQYAHDIKTIYNNYRL
jgi:hypothetical protein